MNKIKSTIAALMSLLTLSACAGSNSKQPTTNQKEKSNMESRIDNLINFLFYGIVKR